MLDPEQMTYMEWFWIVLAMVFIVFFLCRWIDLNYQFQPL